MKTYRTIFLLTIWAGLMLLACTKQEEVYSDTDKVCLSASIGSMTTRVVDGKVESGTYYLTYNSSEAKVCMVTFAASKGYPLVSDGDTIYQFLKWNDVMPEKDGKYLFTLDNLDDKDNPETVTLGEAYKAAPLNDKLNDKLDIDIVWGKKTVEKGKESADVNFALSHRMSKISLEISVGTSGINLDNGIPATITLMNVISEPATFNRTSGDVSVEGKQRSEIKLYEGVLTNDNFKNPIPSWIFPPQTFDEDNWPKLRIVLGDKIYEGTLNHYMVQKESGDDTPFEMTGFKSGLHLTLRAKLSNTTDEVELIFMPVWVRKWEEIDNIGIGAKQRGVYTEEDYKQLVNAYNDVPKNENVLDEYGTDASGKWTFVLFRNIGDTGGPTTIPKFKDDRFEINFNGYKVYGYNNKSHLIDNSETSGGNSGD